MAAMVEAMQAALWAWLAALAGAVAAAAWWGGGGGAGRAGSVGVGHVALLVAAAVAVAWPRRQRRGAPGTRTAAATGPSEPTTAGDATTAADEEKASTRRETAPTSPQIAAAAVATTAVAVTTTTTSSDAATTRDAAGLVPAQDAASTPAAYRDGIEDAVAAVVGAADRLVSGVGTPQGRGGKVAPAGAVRPWETLTSAWPQGPAVFRDTAVAPHHYGTVAPLPVPAEHAFRLITDERNWLRSSSGADADTDPGLQDYAGLVEQVRSTPLAPNTALIYGSTRSFGLASAREALVVVHRRRLPDGRLAVVAFSARDDDAHQPTRASVTRVHVQVCGAVFAPWPEDPDACYVAAIVTVDPKMWIPAALVTMLTRQLTPLVHRTLSKMLRRAPRWDPARAARKRLAAPAVPPPAIAPRPAASALSRTTTGSAGSAAASVARPVQLPRWLATLGRLRTVLQWSSPFVVAVVYVVLMVHVARRLRGSTTRSLEPALLRR